MSNQTLDKLRLKKQEHLKLLEAFCLKFPNVSADGRVVITGKDKQEALVQAAVVGLGITRRQMLFRDIESGFFIRGYTIPVEGKEQIELDLGLNAGPGRYAYMQSHGTYREGLVYIQRYCKSGHHDFGSVQIGTRNDFIMCVYVDTDTMIHDDTMQVVFDFDQLEILSY